MNVSTNGFITFGSTAPTTTNTTPVSSTAAYDGAIAAFGRDISSMFDISGVTGNISWETIGTAPNREVVVQWKNFRPNSSTSTSAAYSFSFQVRLHETSNVINTVYDTGAYVAGSTAVSGTVQIGLRGTSSADFNNRLNATTLEFYNSTAGTANSSTQNFNTGNTVPGMPTSGLTYTWTPPTCWAPQGVVVLSTTSTTANISWTAPSTAPSGYDIYYSTSSVPPTSSTVPSLSGVTGTSVTLPSLTPATAYYVWVRSNCGSGNTSVWSLVSGQFTTACQPPALISTTGATVCGSGTATLNATADAGANVTWYDAATGGNQLGTGTSYTTPVLTTTTNYWATASIGGIQTTGKQTYTTSPSSGAGTTNFGLVFDVLAPLTISSVTIYPVSSTNATGTVTIDVIDGSGAVVKTKTINVTGAPTSAPVAQVVSLDFQMAPGTNYKMRPGFTGISGLLFDPSANAPSGNYGYPYAVPGLLSINTSTLTAAPTNTVRNDLYYYFYDWKIGTKCESARTMVTATVNSSCLSTAEVKEKDMMKVYPNPFTDVINIDRPELVKSIQVTDVSRKLIKNNLQPESVLRLNDLSSGLYILILDMKDGTKQSIKVIKK